MATYQIFVKLLDGKTRCIELPLSTVSGESLKRFLHAKTGIPLHLQRLVTGLREICDETLISAAADGAFPSCTLLLRLRAGKGGFGSLLRGAATKAGQKKTNNFDACRDMSGRRLRHVNAEKKLEEWKAEEEDRRLEKIAEQFLRKKAKEVKKTASKEVEKYIEKYREDSERCMEEVEESVRQSFSLYEKSKRKVLPTSGPGSKRLKMWLGKDKVDQSDSDEDDEDDDSEAEDEKSVVIDDGNRKDDAGSSGTSSGSQSDGESSGVGSDRSNLEEENGFADQNGRFEAGKGSRIGDLHSDSDGSADPQMPVQEETPGEEIVSSGLDGQPDDSIDANLAKENDAESKVMYLEEGSSQALGTSSDNSPVLENVVQMDISHSEHVDIENTTVSLSKDTDISNKISPGREDIVIHKANEDAETSSLDAVAINSDGPLNFDNFNSASELEALGMDRLKVELQANGLKCGGTLQERAARLFLLKTTPVDKLPKKVLAKPSNGGK